MMRHVESSNRMSASQSLSQIRSNYLDRHIRDFEQQSHEEDTYLENYLSNQIRLDDYVNFTQTRHMKKKSPRILTVDTNPYE